MLSPRLYFAQDAREYGWEYFCARLHQDYILWRAAKQAFCELFDSNLRPAYHPAYLRLDGEHLLLEGPRGDAQRAVAEDDELLGGVRGDDARAVAAGYLVRGLFDVHVGRLRLAGVDDVDVVVLLHLALAALDLPGVEHQYQHAAAVAGEVAQDLGVSKPFAYKLVRQMNEELEAKGFITIAGRVSRKYYEEKFYGMAQAN